MSLLLKLGQLVNEFKESWCFNYKLELENLDLKIKVTQLEKDKVDLELNIIDMLMEQEAYQLKCESTLNGLSEQLAVLSRRIEEITKKQENIKAKE